MKRDILGREPKVGDKIIITSSKHSDLKHVHFAKFIKKFGKVRLAYCDSDYRCQKVVDGEIRPMWTTESDFIILESGDEKLGWCKKD